MDRIISEIPDKWVILKAHDNYKVFATWAGGYLDGDRWMLNSGIDSVEQYDGFYYFIGFSGSCYKCHKRRYGLATSYGDMVLSEMIDKSNGKIQLMKDVDDWETEINKLK